MLLPRARPVQRRYSPKGGSYLQQSGFRLPVLRPAAAATTQALRLPVSAGCHAHGTLTLVNVAVATAPSLWLVTARPT
jgi:hypothetical protein